MSSSELFEGKNCKWRAQQSNRASYRTDNKQEKKQSKENKESMIEYNKFVSL
jgi:hypothetical protein